jgi:thymidylate kinase
VLIALEGVDGAGKSELARWLSNWLRARGFKVALTREPWRAPHPNHHAPLATRLAAVCADRREHAAHVVVPLLSQGYVVIADRYHASLAVYEGVNGGREWPVLPLYSRARSLLENTPTPNLWLWLRVPPPLAEHRTGEARFEHVTLRSPASLANLDARYNALMPTLNPSELDSSLPRNAVRALAAAAVVRVCGGSP